MSQKSYTEEIVERSRKDSRLPVEKFGQNTYDLYCVPVEVYNKYKDEILRLSLNYQEWVAMEDDSVILHRVNQLTDTEIATKIGLDEDTVRRIRCMAEWDIPMEVWRNAAEFKLRHRLEKPLGCTDRDIRNEPS
jgi:hypothetical protein